MPAERIVVGMSGGVDSSVAAALLVAPGHDVVGVTLRVWPWQEATEASARFGSLLLARTPSRTRAGSRGALGIPYYVLNMADEFDRTVIDAVRRRVSRRDARPCRAWPAIADVKFGSLLGRAARLGRRRRRHRPLRAGHARRDDGPLSACWRARDARKDQSDFLWPLTQAQLGAARFPVGELTKDEVREYARRLGLVTADKPESQEICFIPDDDYRGFLRRREPAEASGPGSIVDVDGAGARPPRGSRRLHGRPAPRARAGDGPRALRRRPRPRGRTR